MVKKLEGKVALITGAARGLGPAYALGLAKLGADIVIDDINLRSFKEFKAEKEQMKADSVAEEVKQLGQKSIEIEANASNKQAVNEMFNQILVKFGKLDILITNAGGSTGDLNITPCSFSEKNLNQVLDKNLKGTVLCCQAVCETMKKQKSGKVVTISSQAAVNTSRLNAPYAHYGVAKIGIVTYTRYFAQELAPYNINVNCIAPEYIVTGRLKQNFEALGTEEIKRTIPSGRLETSCDCANIVEFLCTDLSDYVTGQVIPVGGGVVLFPV